MSEPLRIVVFGDGSWAAKSALRLQLDGRRIVGIVIRTQPSEQSLEEWARTIGVPCFKPVNVNAPEFIAEVSSLAPDLNLSIAYNQILRLPVLRTAPLGCVNFHAGMLPFYRGRNIVNWAIINGEEEIGMTAHYVDEGIDSGDILLQKTLPVGWADTYGDVLSRVVDSFPGFVAEAVDLIASGKATRRKQSHLMGTYFGGRETGDEWLDWSDTSVNLYNKIRAITRPGPGARTLVSEKEVIIWRASYDRTWPKYIATPGQIVGRQSDGVFVKTGDSTLLVQEVQIAGGECRIPTWRIGTRLGINIIQEVNSLRRRVLDLELRLLRGREKDG